MSYSEEYAGALVVLDLNADGTLKAGNVEKRWNATRNGTPLAPIMERVVLDPAMLVALIPNQADLLIQVNALQAEKTALETAKTQAETAKEQADAQIAQLQEQITNLQNQPAPEPQGEAAFAAAIEAHIDSIARAKAYSGAVSLASYVNSTMPAWKAEAEAFIAWRDAVWLYAYTQLALVQGGQREAPTVAELIAELPAITWPA